MFQTAANKSVTAFSASRCDACFAAACALAIVLADTISLVSVIFLVVLVFLVLLAKKANDGC